MIDEFIGKSFENLSMIKSDETFHSPYVLIHGLSDKWFVINYPWLSYHTLRLYILKDKNTWNNLGNIILSAYNQNIKNAQNLTVKQIIKNHNIDKKHVDYCLIRRIAVHLCELPISENHGLTLLLWIHFFLLYFDTVDPMPGLF